MLRSIRTCPLQFPQHTHQLKKTQPFPTPAMLCCLSTPDTLEPPATPKAHQLQQVPLFERLEPLQSKHLGYISRESHALKGCHDFDGGVWCSLPSQALTSCTSVSNNGPTWKPCRPTGRCKPCLRSPMLLLDSISVREGYK